MGYTLATGGASVSVVALDPYRVLTAAHVVDVPESPPAALIMGAPNPDTRSLSGLGDRSEHGGRASTEVHDIEAHSGSMQRNIGELWAALPPAQ